MAKTLTKRGAYPLSDVAYDIMSILYEKSKALEVYQKYMDDVQPDTQLRQLLVEIRHDDYNHVEKLKAHLIRTLMPSDKSPANTI